MTQSNLINLQPNDYNQKLHHYPFAVKSDRCVESYNTLNDLSNKVCLPNKTEDSNLNVLNVIIGTNESKITNKSRTKHISCECKYRFDGRKCNSDQWWNINKYRCEYKKHHIWEKDDVSNTSTCI